MRKQLKLLCWSFIVLHQIIYSQETDINGQASAWILKNDQTAGIYNFGLRYIPDFYFNQQLTETFALDLEYSANAFINGEIRKFEKTDACDDLKHYRMWLRLSTSQFEARLGLQKLNFGSATLLRPLMWFDLIDPRDPLRITDGVYGLLLKYYFLNNANIWLWSLYGNDDLKGWEFIPTLKDQPEFGGRCQIPLFTGELAFSFHYRKLDLAPIIKQQYPFVPISMIPQEELEIPENRIGIDGKWDMSIGFWIEGVLVHQESDYLPNPWRRSFNIGLDYTFDIGNGINVVGEYFEMTQAAKAFESGDGILFSAATLNYPVRLLDRFSSIFYFDWENDDFYWFINWQRTYDNWNFYLIAFWNPETYRIYQNQSITNLMTGKGFQIMAVFNH